MRRLPQALVAIITPFAEDLSVDLDAHRHNVSVLVSQGCTGFVIGGSTGEGPYLDPGERGSLVEATRSAAPDAAIVCGINAESVRQAVRQIDEIANADADIALVATPTTLIRGMHALVEDFYRHVADSTPIPVLLYSNPSVVAYEIPTASVSALSGHPNIIGIKDSGGNPARFDEFAAAINAGFVVFSGASKTLRESAEHGATGAVTASANYAFDLVVEAIRGDAEAQAELTTLTSAIEPNGRAGTKYAAIAAGLIGGRLRPPLVPIDADARAGIDAVLDSRKRSQRE
jgi:4-hydroxy-2-oxoglutarate aldolase